MADALKKFQNVELYKSPLATQENINKYLQHVKLELWCNNVFTIVTKRRSTLVEFTIFKVEIIELEIERIKYINRENKIVYSTERGLLDMNDEEEKIISNLLFNTVYTLLQDEWMTKFSGLETKAMLFSKIKWIIEKEIIKGNLSTKEVAILEKYHMFPSIVIYILERELFIKFDADDCLIANEDGFPKLFASIQTSSEKSKSQFLNLCWSFLRQYRHVLE